MSACGDIPWAYYHECPYGPFTNKTSVKGSWKNAITRWKTGLEEDVEENEIHFLMCEVKMQIQIWELKQN